MKKLMIPFFALLLVSGCILSETKHILYLDPDGTLTWSILETNIHSNSARSEDRQKEEKRFMDNLTSGKYGKILAFQVLYPLSLDHRILRMESPFSVWTEARFSSIEWLVQDFAEKSVVPVESWFSEEDDQVHFEMVLYPALYQEDDDRIEIFYPLFNEPEDYQIFLTHGRFIAAQGFNISQDGRLATFIYDENSETKEKEEEPMTEPIVLSLTWTTEAP